MFSKLGNGKRLSGSQLGYHGKGVPDPETLSALQAKYCNALVAGDLPYDVRSKLERMRALAATALHGEENKLQESEISKAFDELLMTSAELAPILHFNVDEVDWDK